MEFPFHISIGNLDIHPHFFFDVIAYFIAYQIYRKQRPKNYLGSDSAHPIGLLIYAITGAFLFSKCLAWLEHPYEYFSIWSNKDMTVSEKLSILNQGKTIVGGIIGGWMGVELYKAKRKINTSSGDCYAIPLCIGMMIGLSGRVGQRGGLHPLQVNDIVRVTKLIEIRFSDSMTPFQNRRHALKPLCDHPFNDVSEDVRQSFITSLVEIGQAFMIQAQ